jgi:hypothetical protein
MILPPRPFAVALLSLSATVAAVAGPNIFDDPNTPTDPPELQAIVNSHQNELHTLTTEFEQKVRVLTDATIGALQKQEQKYRAAGNTKAADLTASRRSSLGKESGAVAGEGAWEVTNNRGAKLRFEVRGNDVVSRNVKRPLERRDRDFVVDWGKGSGVDVLTFVDGRLWVRNYKSMADVDADKVQTFGYGVREAGK